MKIGDRVSLPSCIVCGTVKELNSKTAYVEWDDHLWVTDDLKMRGPTEGRYELDELRLIDKQDG